RHRPGEVLPRDGELVPAAGGDGAQETLDDLVGRGTGGGSVGDERDGAALGRQRVRGPHRPGVGDAHAAGQRQQRRDGDEQAGAQRAVPGPAVEETWHGHRPPVLSRSGRGTTSSSASATGSASAGAAGSGSGEEEMTIPALRGRVSRKAAPSPGLPHASSVPACSRASSREIDSPSPVPPEVRARAGSPRQNRSKTRPASSGVMPAPWSRTRTATAVSLTPTEISIGLPSPCSIAFTRR